MGKKILVLDDDSIIVEYLTDLFEDNGYETCYACDAEEGFKILVQENPYGLLSRLEKVLPSVTSQRHMKSQKKIIKPKWFFCDLKHSTF